MHERQWCASTANPCLDGLRVKDAETGRFLAAPAAFCATRQVVYLLASHPDAPSRQDASVARGRIRLSSGERFFPRRPFRPCIAAKSVRLPRYAEWHTPQKISSDI